MFIDPYLKCINKASHKEFQDLLLLISENKLIPKVEIHFSEKKENVNGKYQKIFKKIAENLKAQNSKKMKIEIFIWEEFHDRYLISNLIGISLPYGFGTGQHKNLITTWTRLGRADKDKVQREFDPATRFHKLIDRFTV